MSPFEPLQFDARNKMHIVSTEDIAYIASKKNFDPAKELKYIEKFKKSVCKCHHPHFIGGRCFYRTCRHTITNHLGFGESYSDPENLIIAHNEDYMIALKELTTKDVRCSCGRRFRVGDLTQHQWEESGKIDTFAHCPKCMYDMAVWKFKNHAIL